MEAAQSSPNKTKTILLLSIISPYKETLLFIIGGKKNTVNEKPKRFIKNQKS
jgi:hypothetical protein